jgi:ABC-2 type transport system ATP-binding protein
MTAVVETRGLTKDFGGRGLFELDLEIASGEAFGLLGPNGAGKTTTIRLLMGFLRPTAGSAAIDGRDCWRQAVETKREVGYVPGELPDFGGLRGAEVVSLIAGLRGDIDRPRVAELATRLDLDLGRRYREYSRGNKQKLALVLAFAHRPRLLILDEPTGGLDPLNQQEFHRLVEEARKDGATVFLSSHILSEVEHTCDRIGIVRRGRLIEVARLADLHHLRYRVVEIEYADGVPEAAVRAVPGVDHVRVEGRRLTCEVRGDFSPFLAAASQSGIATLTSREPSLEEVFLARYRDEQPVGVA